MKLSVQTLHFSLLLAVLLFQGQGGDCVEVNGNPLISPIRGHRLPLSGGVTQPAPFSLTHSDIEKSVQDAPAHRKNLSQIPDASGFYTQPYGYVFLHYMANFGMWKDTEELYDFLSHFETIWVGNVFAIPQTWIDVLRKEDGLRRTLFFYESFPGPHFIFGKDSPQPYEAWQVDFLDNHREDIFSINPLIPPDFLEYAPGQWSAGQPWSDYFVNYGNRDAEDFLIHQFYDIKRSEIGYDGLFFDLMGGAFINGAFVQDPENPGQSIRANTQYNSLSETRDSPEFDYDANAANFLARLREKNPDPLAFPVWGNQAYRSNRPGTAENDYYKYLTHDLSESTFTTWLNPNGWKAGVRVFVNENWVETANPVETRIIPFFEGLDLIKPMMDQRDYAKANYSNEVKIVTTN